MPLLYLSNTIILISESNRQWKSRFSKHSCQLMGKVSPQTSLDHKKFRGEPPPSPLSPLAAVYDYRGKGPAQCTAWLPEQGFIYLLLWQELQPDHSQARGCICSSRFP